jgi:hypothetical protein
MQLGSSHGVTGIAPCSLAAALDPYIAIGSMSHHDGPPLLDLSSNRRGCFRSSLSRSSRANQNVGLVFRDQVRHARKRYVRPKARKTMERISLEDMFAVIHGPRYGSHTDSVIRTMKTSIACHAVTATRRWHEAPGYDGLCT